VELVLGVSFKLDDSYLGAQEQVMVTVRVVGHHTQRLLATLEHLAASAQVEERHDMDDHGEEWDGQGEEMHQLSKEAGAVVLQLKREISFMGASKYILATEATEAIEFVGRLLGLSLRAGTDAAAVEAEEEQGSYDRVGRRGLPDLKTTPFAQSVLAFVRVVAQATTWDADEGTFPVHATLRQAWDSGKDIGDTVDDDGYNSDDKYGWREIVRLCGPFK
jgi:hypothetical protein